MRLDDQTEVLQTNPMVNGLLNATMGGSEGGARHSCRGAWDRQRHGGRGRRRRGGGGLAALMKGMTTGKKTTAKAYDLALAKRRAASMCSRAWPSCTSSTSSGSGTRPSSSRPWGP